MKIGVIGTGSWGTALAQVLCDNGQDVLMYGLDSNEVNEINEKHTLSKFFGDYLINSDIKATNNLEEVVDREIILMAVPTMAVESVSKQINELASSPKIIINVAKGFHPKTHQLLSEVIASNIDSDKLKAIVSLIGPSHAEEVIERRITTVNAVTENEEVAHYIQNIFSNEYFRVYRNSDVIGAQVGVAIKNIISVASGVLEGLNLGDNAKAALITRGLAEMTRYGVALGGSSETFLGLCGVGDLVVTCTSPHSRNFQAGLEIGKSKDAKKFMETNTKTVEGIHAAKAIYNEANLRKIEMPITTEVYKVLYEGKDPELALNDLMLRDLKSE